MNDETRVDAYIKKHVAHKESLITLRKAIKEHPFIETIKWGMPTYTLGGTNLIGLGAFKAHVALWFFQGALLKDPNQILHNAQEGKTKAMRQIHYQGLTEINLNQLRPLLVQTIENQDNGLKVKFDRKPIQVEVPDILDLSLHKDQQLKESFLLLTPGKQKDYCVYIQEAKREQTKLKRFEKILPLIKAGKGLNDQYKKY